MLDSCIPINPRLRVVCRVLQKVFNFVDIKLFWLSPLFSFRWNSVPKVTIAQSPRDTVAQFPRDTVLQSPRDTVAQSSRDTKAQSFQRHKIRDSKIKTLVLLGQQSQLSTNETSSSSSSSSPGRRTKCNGCLPLCCAEA